MSNTKLDPRSLTSEERAIVDALVLRYLDACLPLTDAQLFQRAAHLSVEMIVARRKFFGEPASDPAGVECPECGEMASENHEVVQSDGLEGGRRLFFYTCQQRISELDDRHNRMASPEYQAKVKADMSRRAVEIGMDRLVGITAFPVGNCPTCGELVAPWNKHAKYEGGYSCKPAQPEPVAEEMPEAMRNAANSLRACAVKARYPAILTERADALESFWRSLAAQPAPSVAMTEELERVLDAAEAHSGWHMDQGRPESFDEIDAAIASVRSQAAEAGKVRLPKVRIALDTMRAHFEPNCQGQCRFPMVWEFCIAALAELDAAEGRK